MTSAVNASKRPESLTTSLRLPRRWFYWCYVGFGALMAAQNGIRLALMPAHPALSWLNPALAIAGLVLGAVVIALALAALRLFRQIVVHFDADGIAAPAWPGWTVRWCDIETVRLTRQGSWVQLAVLERDEPRARRRRSRLLGTPGLPAKTLVTSFPAEDEPAVRAILDAHYVTPSTQFR